MVTNQRYDKFFTYNTEFKYIKTLIVLSTYQLIVCPLIGVES